MNVPCSKLLVNQTFNSEFVEFVWKFEKNVLLVCQFRKDCGVYFECDEVNSADDFINDPPKVARLYGHYNYFSKGIPTPFLDERPDFLKELEKLGEDVVEYLKSI